MDTLLKWIVVLALGSFAAGCVVGHVVSDAVASGNEVPASEHAYVADLSANYGLDARQQHRLYLVLQHDREAEIATLKSAQESQLPPELIGKLKLQRSRTDQRIRALLDDEQRARYDRDSRPFGTAERR